jgi:TldD protein
MSSVEAQSVARNALEIAKASARLRGESKVILAEEPVRRGVFRTPIEIAPFSVSPAEKLALLVAVNEKLLKVKGIKKAFAWMEERHTDQIFGNTEGSILETETSTTLAGYRAVAVENGESQTRSFQTHPKNAGYEHILELRLLDHADRVANEAVEKLKAPEPDEAIRDLVLDPSHLALTIHESVGHATELDRVLGYEANYAGRSFATTDKLGRYRYGSPLVNFVADNALPGGLATTGYDDEGVECQRWDIIREGILVGYSTTREVARFIGESRSRGSARADGFASFPIGRIPNLCLMPGKTSATPEDLASEVKDGILIVGEGSFSIDQMRLNFQFGGDGFWEIKNGKRTRMLKNVLYWGITPQFWNSLDGLSDERFRGTHGFVTCGKGEPSQWGRMTHASPWARFRKVKTGRGRR